MPWMDTRDSVERETMRSPGLIDVAVFLGGGGAGSGAVEWAAALAQEHDARLMGIYIEPEIIDSAEARSRSADERISFEAAVRRHGLRAEWWALSQGTSASLVQHARHADVTIVARPHPSELPGGLADLPERLVLASGRPAIVVPPGRAAAAPRRVLVGWNASPEAARAVAGAMPLLVRAEAVQILVIHREGDASAEGWEPGADAALHLARHGAQVEVCRASYGGDLAGVLVSPAAAFEADLVVIGARAHRMLEGRLSNTTRAVMLQSVMPVLMCR